jgi:ubiquinone/menaquinone biosynthesis C-methylase UbiE
MPNVEAPSNKPLDPEHKVRDVSKIFVRWNSLGPVVLDLGCGPNKRHENWVGIDQTNYHCVDLQGDIFDVLEKIEDGSVDHIYSSHFFEHIDDVSRLVKEITRILKVGGSIKVIVPHFSNPYFFSDYTHKTFFGLYSFSYFARDEIYQRRVPMYFDLSDRLALKDVKLVFKSTRPFYFRYAIKKFFEKIFNSTRYMQELYEENLSNFVSCYEIHFSLEKDR